MVAKTTNRELESVRDSELQMQERQQNCHSHAPTTTTVASDTSRSKELRKQRVIARTLPAPMSAARALPLLVCSVGNPGAAYANTLHSAGHFVVTRLAGALGYQQFSKDRGLGNGLVSRPRISSGSGDWTLWQSTSYMNESGRGVRAAHATWSKGMSASEEGRLVVIYDELEKPLGVVTVRTVQGASAKGHNGLKSIMSVIGNTPFVRIGIGIGRPVSRDSNDVARYVLKKMDENEKTRLEGCIEEVIAKLKQLEQG